MPHVGKSKLEVKRLTVLSGRRYRCCSGTRAAEARALKGHRSQSAGTSGSARVVDGEENPSSPPGNQLTQLREMVKKNQRKEQDSSQMG